MKIKIPKKGDRVKIIIKPYKEKTYLIGVIKEVLTKKKYHSHGHKVRLNNGKIGRVVKILSSI
jgi:uncharacterized repeat protein (TIGR03833 family)